MIDPTLHTAPPVPEVIDEAGRRWTLAPDDPSTVSVHLDAAQIEVLRKHHARKAAAAAKAGRTDEVERHDEQGSVLLAASIALRLPPEDPAQPRMAVTLIDGSGRDGKGRAWSLLEPAPGLRNVPLSSGPCLAVWQAYSFEASRARAAGDQPRADFCEQHAQAFLAMARSIEPSLGIMAENAPGYGQAGWS